MTEAKAASILYLDCDRKDSLIVPILRRDLPVLAFQVAARDRDDTLARLKAIEGERINVIARSQALGAAAHLIASMPDRVETLCVLAPPPPRADGALDPEIAPLLKQLNVPTMLLFGTRDEVSPPQLGRLYRRLLPQARLMFVFDTTAQMDNERPEAVAAIIREFILAKERFVVTSKSGQIYP